MKTGLVFAGGGGKGAYELGVWKAFKEYGVDKTIEAVSGTSVGGLNGALFAKGDFDQGLKIWEQMSPDKILQVDIESVISAISKLHPSTRVSSIIADKLGILKSRGIFDQAGLEEIIRDSLNDGDLKDKIPFYICATDVSSKLSWKPLYKQLNKLPYEDIVQYLLATSAIPVAFQTTIVEDVELLDGFLTDNTPMKPLIENEQCDNIIVVLLGRSENIIEEKEKYPHVKFWEIVPTGDTKEDLGSLDFKSETATKLIEMGYRDTLKILQNLYEFMLIEKAYIKNGETLKLQHDGFKKHLSNNALLRDEYKQLQDNYNDMSSLEFLLTNQNDKQSGILTKKKHELSLTTVSEELALSINKADCEVINNELDKVLDSMHDNSKEMTKFAYDAVTSLASNDGKINYQVNQGTFSRFMGSITGRDHKLQADINLNFSRSIYANTQMIKKLAERNNLTLDMCISLGNKVNFLAQNQNHLQLQNNQQLKMIGSLRDAIFTLADVTRTAIQSNTDRIAKLEHGQQLLNWSHHLNSSIKELNSYESIVKIVSSYYDIVHVSDSDNTSEFLYSALVNCGFDKITINPNAFLEYVIDSKKLDASFLPVPKASEPYVPVFSSVAKIYEKNQDVEFNEIISPLEERYGINLNTDMSGIDFAFELLTGFKISNDMKRSLGNAKTQLLTSLNSLDTILKDDNINTFEKEIVTFKQKIENFKVVVPVIGKFSSGKSKLLNTYITTKDKLFEVDTNPTTALPCEIQYARTSIVKVHDQNDNISQIGLNDVSKIDIENTNYLQYFLNYPRLQNKEDLIIVDMPGFESSNLNHNNAINRYFNKGNHYILALSCESANDSSILKHIREIVSYGAKFSVIITKSDKKPPTHIDEIVKVVTQNIADKYPNEKFFVGVTSSFKNRLEDFEKIIDEIYEDAPTTFEDTFKRDLEILTAEIVSYYKKLLNAPNDLIEFEKKIISDQKIFDNEVSQLNAKLNEMKFKIVLDGHNRLIDKINSVLNANVSTLVNSAKNNTLPQSITELLRPSVNSLLKKITAESLQTIEKESLNLSNDINISFGNVQIDTNLSIFGAIKNFFFNTQNKEIRDELKSSVIPSVVNDISANIKLDLATLYETIKALVDEKIEEKRKISTALESEIKEKISLKTKEYEQLQDKLNKSLLMIEKGV